MHLGAVQIDTDFCILEMDQHDPLQTWLWNGNPNKTGKRNEVRLILVWMEEIRLTNW